MDDAAKGTIAHYERHVRTWDADRRAGGWSDKSYIETFLSYLSASARVLDLGCGGGDPVALHLYARVRILCASMHTRPRVQRAPGLPCALSVLGANDFVKLGQKPVARTRTHISSSSRPPSWDPYSACGPGLLLNNNARDYGSQLAGRDDEW
jgi:hypothetical protein